MFIQNFLEWVALARTLSVQEAEQLSLGGCLTHVALRHSDSWSGVFSFETLTYIEWERGIGMSSQQKAGQSPCCG